MSAPQDLKDSQYAMFQQAQLSALQVAFSAAADVFYDAGVASNPVSGITPEQEAADIAAKKALIKSAVDAAIDNA